MLRENKQKEWKKRRLTQNLMSNIQRGFLKAHISDYSIW